MKKYGILMNIGIGVLATTIIAVVLFKFVINRNPASFAITGIEETRVWDLSGNELKLDRIISENNTVHILLFNLKDCHSCIADGVEILNKLKKEGRQCAGIAIHDQIDDFSGWTINFDFTPFYMMRTATFFDHIKCPVTPVLLIFKNQKINSYTFLLPH